jgi:hypothetical protein
VLSGTVIIRPEQATARAQLSRLVGDRRKSILEASSFEALSLGRPAGLSAPMVLGVTAMTAADRRQDASYLADLATVLACKFSVRWMEHITPDRQPASWQTVYDMSRGLAELEP